MLTLTRKVDESIVIGDGDDKIEIVVKEIRRNQVRIGVHAPPNLKIFRKELYEKFTPLANIKQKDKPKIDKS